MNASCRRPLRWPLLLACVLAGLALAGPAKASQTVELYVSPAGDDQAAGDAQHPFATPARAKEQVRRLLCENKNLRCVVRFHEGVYFLAAPLAFTPEDSPAADGFVRYEGLPGERVVLSAGQPLADCWTPVGQDVWSIRYHSDADLGSPLPQLFATKSVLQRSRFPLFGEVFLQGASSDWRDIHFKAPLNAPAVADPSSVEFKLYALWAVSRIGVESLRPDAVRVRQPFGVHGVNEQGEFYWNTPNADCFGHLENARSFISRPFDWAHDAAAGTLFLKTPPGTSPTDFGVVAPRLENVVSLRGTDDEFVQNVSFANLTFSHAHWPTPARGILALQADAYGPELDQTVVLPAAIVFAKAKNCAVEQCVVEDSSGVGVGIGHHCRGIRIEGGILRRLGGSAIVDGYQEVSACVKNPFSDWLADECAPQDSSIRRNDIHDVGLVNDGSVGIFSAFTKRTTIAENTVRDAPYTGISVGFKWNDAPSSHEGTLVENNVIHHVMRKLTDGGAIYTLGRQPGTRIVGNKISHVMSFRKHMSWMCNGMFLDEGSSGFVIAGNVIRAPHPLRFNRSVKEAHVWRDNMIHAQSEGFPASVPAALLSTILSQ